MIKLSVMLKSTLLLIVISGVLTGCLGGNIAQQIASTIATNMADKVVASAMDVQDEPFASEKKESQAKSIELPKKIVLKDTPPDPYTIAFVNARFEPVKPIAEPLPEQVAEMETPVAVAVSSKLVRVQLFNLLIGDEKAAIYAKAQLIGASSLPKQREWKSWQVATGKVTSDTSAADISASDKYASISALANKKLMNKDSAQSAQLILFLIPPEFGKLPSGSMTLVEIASPGELNIARYIVN